MSNSPWNAYGRLPSAAQSTESGLSNGSSDRAKSPIAGVVNEVLRGREKLDQYLNSVLREYFEIQSGNTGYRSIIADALTPSSRPETIEERLNRLASEAQLRRPAPRIHKPRNR
jgi:hypothetical protein